MKKYLIKFATAFLFYYFDFYFYNKNIFSIKKIALLKYFFRKRKIKVNLINKTIFFNSSSFFIYNFFNLYLKNHNDLIYEKEQIIFTQYLAKKYKIFIDIGANFGLYSKILASESGNFVYAIELMPGTFYHLKKNTQNNKNIKIFNIGISDSNNKIMIPNFYPIKMSSNLKTKIDSKHQKKIELFTLDKFINVQNIHNVDCIKIDIEGAEANIFRLKNIKINTLKPILILELHGYNIHQYNSSVIETNNNIVNMSYIPFKFKNNKLLKINLNKDVINNDENHTFIYIPLEKLNDFEKNLFY